MGRLGRLPRGVSVHPVLRRRWRRNMTYPFNHSTYTEALMRQLLIAALLSAAGVPEAVAAQRPKLVHIVVVQGSPKGDAVAEIHILRAPDSRNVIVLGRKATAFDL